MNIGENLQLEIHEIADTEELQGGFRM